LVPSNISQRSASRVPLRAFDLQPVAAFAGGVAAVASFADDALEAEAPAVFHQQTRVVELLDQEQARHDGFAFRQRVELPLTRDDRLSGEVGAIGLEQVEGIVD